MTKVKICGINTIESRDAAISAGADFLGFVFHPSSPRHLSVENAAALTAHNNSDVSNVGLFVNPTPEQVLEHTASTRLDLIQLHGEEDIALISEIIERTKLPVMKAIRVESIEDLALTKEYESLCSWLLLDAKSDKALGGTGEQFDWSLLENFSPSLPWMLAGGLDISNIDQAIQLKPSAVDVSSGIEDEPGKKNAQKIKEFVAAVHQRA